MRQKSRFLQPNRWGRILNTSENLENQLPAMPPWRGESGNLPDRRGICKMMENFISAHFVASSRRPERVGGVAGVTGVRVFHRNHRPLAHIEACTVKPSPEARNIGWWLQGEMCRRHATAASGSRGPRARAVTARPHAKMPGALKNPAPWKNGRPQLASYNDSS
jgi:hypothetical protein